MSTESGEKLAAELADSFDKRPLKPETKLPKKAKEGEQPANPGPDVTYMETSAKSNKNIEGVSQGVAVLMKIHARLQNGVLCAGLPRHRQKDQTEGEDGAGAE